MNAIYKRNDYALPSPNHYFVFSPWNPSTNVLPALSNPQFRSFSEFLTASTSSERSVMLPVVTVRQNTPRAWVQRNDFSKRCIISLSDNGSDANGRRISKLRLLSRKRNGEMKRDGSKEGREAAWGNDVTNRGNFDAIIGCRLLWRISWNRMQVEEYIKRTLALRNWDMSHTSTCEHRVINDNIMTFRVINVGYWCAFILESQVSLSFKRRQVGNM